MAAWSALSQIPGLLLARTAAMAVGGFAGWAVAISLVPWDGFLGGLAVGGIGFVVGAIVGLILLAVVGSMLAPRTHPTRRDYAKARLRLDRELPRSDGWTWEEWRSAMVAEGVPEQRLKTLDDVAFYGIVDRGRDIYDIADELIRKYESGGAGGDDERPEPPRGP